MQKVYFFECHDAPFTALDDSKMYPWLEGFQEDFHLGRTAKSVSKNRGLQFERALLMASVEFEKPVEFRLDWNLQDETNENENRQLDAHNNSARNTNNANTNRLVQTNVTKKRRTAQSNNGLNKKKGRHLNRNEQSSTLSSNRMKRRGTRTNNNLDLMDVEFEEEASDLAIALKLSGEEHYQRNRTRRGGRKMVKNPKIYFRIIVRKIPSGTNPFSVDAVNNNFFTKSNGKEDKSMDFFHIGFITMDEYMVMSESSFTFSEMRGIMEKELVGDEDVPTLPKKWRFFTYSLGVMRSEQEQKFLVNEFFCQSTSSHITETNIFDEAEVQSDETGDGSYSSPFTIMIQDVSPSISSEDLVCHEILPINLT